MLVVKKDSSYISKVSDFKYVFSLERKNNSRSCFFRNVSLDSENVSLDSENLSPRYISEIWKCVFRKTKQIVRNIFGRCRFIPSLVRMINYLLLYFSQLKHET